MLILNLKCNELYDTIQIQSSINDSFKIQENIKADRFTIGIQFITMFKSKYQVSTVLRSI